ncbi:MAG TPA: GTPase HflX, partial [Cryobacterium sp.]|nr:GTPase HflX [Cryobacterium sp.]
MTESNLPDETDDVVARVLASADSKAAGYSLFRSGSAQALQAESGPSPDDEGHDGVQQDREDR